MKIHQMRNNIATSLMAEQPDTAHRQIDTILAALGDGEYEYFSIYRVPPDTEYDEFPDVHERIQCGGDGHRFTVEVSRLDPDGLYRLYVVGHAQAAEECDESEKILFNVNTYSVRPNEVLRRAEAISLFRHYYDHNCIPARWHLRERPEFTQELQSEESKTTLATNSDSQSSPK